MSKFISVTIVCALFLMNSLAVLGFEKDFIAYNVIDGTNTVKVIRKNTNWYPPEVHIPEQVTYGGKTFTVVSIDSWAFFKSEGNSIFYIPKTVTKIDDGAFEESTCKKVIFESGCEVAEFPRACFKNSLIEEFRIPQSVREIHEDAFYGCRRLVYIFIPSTVQVLWSRAFEGCDEPWKARFDWPLEIDIEEGPTTLLLRGSGTINTRPLKLNVGRRYRSEKVVAGNPRVKFATVTSVSFSGEGDPDDYTATGYEKTIKIYRRIYPKYMVNGRFDAANKFKCKLIVPKDMINLYEETPFWSVFHNIEGF